MELRRLGERQLNIAVYLSIPCVNVALSHMVVCSQISTNPGQPSGKFDEWRYEGRDADHAVDTPYSLRSRQFRATIAELLTTQRGKG